MQQQEPGIENSVPSSNARNGALSGPELLGGNRCGTNTVHDIKETIVCFCVYFRLPDNFPFKDGTEVTAPNSTDVAALELSHAAVVRALPRGNSTGG